LLFGGLNETAKAFKIAIATRKAVHYAIKEYPSNLHKNKNSY
jgi:hypothetical protein